MTSFLSVVSALKEQMQATLSRSDVLRPLAWLIGLLIVALLGCVVGEAPVWLLIALASLVVPTVILYGWAYIFCLLRNPDHLRSEKYTLHKLAIEQGLLGDSLVGLFEADQVNEKANTIEHDQFSIGEMKS